MFIPVVLSLVAVMAQEATARDLTEPSPYRLRAEGSGSFRMTELGTTASAYRPDDNKTAAARALATQPYAEIIHKAASASALDPALVHAVIYVESRYAPKAVSNKGAIGLMQVLPETAARYGIANPAKSPEANVNAGTRYLRDLMQKFDGRIDLVLAAYNSGENAVINHGFRMPPYPEPRHYVPAVLARYQALKEPPGPLLFEYLPGTRLEK